MPLPSDLWAAFHALALRHPDRDGLIHSRGRTTFAQLRERAEVYRRFLVHRGVRCHDRVIVWTENQPEVAAAILGVWGARGVAVLMDPGESRGHVEHARKTVAPVMLLHAGSFGFGEDLGAPAVLFEEVEGELPETPRSPGLVTDPASILFTSGSTGRPKAVTQTHGSLLRGSRAVGSYLRLTFADRILGAIPWSFDYGYGQLLSTLVLGAAQVLPEDRSPRKLCEAIEEFRPTVLPGVPSLFGYLLLGISPFKSTDCSCLRVVTNTGGSLPGPVLSELLDRFGGRLVLNYGLTESYRTSYLPPEWTSRKPQSIGRGIPGVEVLVVDPQGRPLPAGERGEIVHRGDYLFRGYWGDEEATARALRPDPLAPEGLPNPPPVLFTGDVGWMDEEGFLYFEGRRDHLIKCMGIRVSPREVEELLLSSGLVREAAVFGMPHELMGQEVWAAVVPAESQEDVERRLKAFARSAMTEAMVPRRIQLYLELPRTRTGKIDHPALRRSAGAGSPL